MPRPSRWLAFARSTTSGHQGRRIGRGTSGASSRQARSPNDAKHSASITGRSSHAASTVNESKGTSSMWADSGVPTGTAAVTRPQRSVSTTRFSAVPPTCRV